MEKDKVEELEEKKKDEFPVIMVLLVLIFMIGIGLGFAACKLIAEGPAPSKSTDVEEKETKKEETKKEETKTSEESSECLKERVCTGTYTGTGAVLQDTMTKELTEGKITVELKEDKTIMIKKDDMGYAGTYRIIDNTILVKIGNDTSGPGSVEPIGYSEYLTITDDCSTISNGYGGVFFDPNFTLNKQ